MKFKILIALILFNSNLLAQKLPISPATGLVSISDSIQFGKLTEKDFKSIVSRWQKYLSLKSNIEKIFSLNTKQETLSISIRSNVFNPSEEVQKNLYTNTGTIEYIGYKRDPIFKEATSLDWTNGKVTFNYFYSIRGSQFFYEFTNLEFTGSGSGGKFENEKPDKPFSVGVLAQNKKRWAAIKIQYVDRIKKLSEDFKRYSNEEVNTMSTNPNSELKSEVSYDTYKKISNGMIYDEVKRLLGSEGKELNNGTTQINGKAMIQQTIVWNDLDKSKSITVNFTDGKVTSKSQTNL